MNYRSVVLINILFLAIACEWNHLPESVSRSGEDLCGVEDPLRNIQWLQEKVAEMEAGKGRSGSYPYFYVLQAELNGETVFVFDNCCPNCGTVVLTYNCDGEVVWEGRNRDGVQHEKVLWQPEGFQCVIVSHG